MRKLLSIFLVVAVGACALFLIAMIPKRGDEGPPSEAPPVNVTVEVIKAEPDLPDTSLLPGVVEANRVVTVSAEVAGRIEQINCTEGAPCQVGDPLISINTDLLKAEFDRAAAQAKYDKQEHERMRSLAEGGAATAKQRDEAEYKMNLSNAEMDAARARLERAKILAPIAGILNELLVEKGEYVQSGTPAAQIVDIATVKVVAEVPERDVHFFKKGDQVEILTGAETPEVRLVGAITYIGELADESSRTSRLEVTLDNREHLLRSGQIIRVRLTRRILKNVIMIPLQVVIPLEHGKEVYVVEEGKAQSREIELGLIKGDHVQVASGLKPGDRLIVSGHRYVAPGQKVLVISEN